MPTANEDGFSGPQVCKIVGITYRQLDYWARTDLLKPSIKSARGSGTQRRYSYEDLLELKVIKRMLDADISLQSSRKAIGYLRGHLGADLATANLVMNDGKSVLAHSGEEIVDLLRGGQTVLNIVPLAGVREELDAAIHELDHARAVEAAGTVDQNVPEAADDQAADDGPATASGG
ncbi:MAG: MerR family transcriptional regulator [Acidimicrobiales bacterium]